MHPNSLFLSPSHSLSASGSSSSSPRPSIHRSPRRPPIPSALPLSPHRPMKHPPATLPAEFLSDAFPSTIDASSPRPARSPAAFQALALPGIPGASPPPMHRPDASPRTQASPFSPPRGLLGPSPQSPRFQFPPSESPSAASPLDHWRMSMMRQGLKSPTQSRPKSSAAQQSPSHPSPRDSNATRFAFSSFNAYRAPQLALLGTVIPLGPGVKKCVSPYCNLSFQHGHASLAEQRDRDRSSSPVRPAFDSTFTHRVIRAVRKSEREQTNSIHSAIESESNQLEVNEKALAEKKERDQLAKTMRAEQQQMIQAQQRESRSPSPPPQADNQRENSAPAETIAQDSAQQPETCISPHTQSSSNLNVTVSTDSPAESNPGSPATAGASRSIGPSSGRVSPILNRRRRGSGDTLNPKRISFSASASPFDSGSSSPMAGAPSDSLTGSSRLSATAEKLLSLMPGLERKKTMSARQSTKFDEEKRQKLEQWKAEKEEKEKVEREAKEKEAERVKRHRTMQLKQRMEMDAVMRASQEAQMAEEEKQRRVVEEQKKREEEEKKQKAREEMLKAREEKEREREKQREIEAKRKAEDDKLAAELAALKAAEVKKRLEQGEFTKVSTVEEREAKAIEKKLKAEARLAAQKAESERIKAAKAAERERKRQAVQQQYENSLLSVQQNAGVKERAKKRKLLISQFNKERGLEEQGRKKAKLQREANIKRLQTALGDDIEKRLVVEKLLLKASVQEELIKLNDRLRLASEEVELRVLELAEAMDSDVVEEIEDIQRADKMEEERAKQLQSIILPTDSQGQQSTVHELEAVPEMSEETRNFETRPGQLMAKRAQEALASPGSESPNKSGASTPLNLGALATAIERVDRDRSGKSSRRESGIVERQSSTGNAATASEDVEEDAEIDREDEPEDAEDNETSTDIAALSALPSLQSVIASFGLDTLARQLAYCIRSIHQTHSQPETAFVLGRKAKIKKLLKLYKRRIQLEAWRKEKLQAEEAARLRAQQHEEEVKSRLLFALKKRLLWSLLAKRARRIEDRKRRELEQGRPFTKEELENMRSGNMASFISMLTGQIKKEREEREAVRLAEERRQRDEAARKAREEEERMKLEQERDREAKLQERLEQRKLAQKMKEEKELEEQRLREQKLKEIADKQKELAGVPLTLKRQGTMMKSPTSIGGSGALSPGGQMPGFQRKPSSMQTSQ